MKATPRRCGANAYPKQSDYTRPMAEKLEKVAHVPHRGEGWGHNTENV